MTVIDPAIDQTLIQTTEAAAIKQRRPRRKDCGAVVLSHMEHFICLVRRLKRPALLHQLLTGLVGTLPQELVDALGVTGSLPLEQRNVVFSEIGKWELPQQACLERASERITLLSDRYGVLAVNAMLDDTHPLEAELLRSPSDKFCRALYLFLQQEFSDEKHKKDARFDHAETRQAMLSQFKHEKYSSHYSGPKNVQPTFDGDVEEQIKLGLSELFPRISPEDIVIEKYEHHRIENGTRKLMHLTINALFNGKNIHFQQVCDGTVEDHDVPAVTSVRYAWNTDNGQLVVFCDDTEVRSELAKLFRDVALGGNGDVHSMPLLEFDLGGFRTPGILDDIQNNCVDGIEAIEIKALSLAKPEVRYTGATGVRDIRLVENPLNLRLHKHEDRHIYQVASQSHGCGDFTGHIVKQAKLAVRIRGNRFRKAHLVSVQLTAPNGFNDRSKTEEDRTLILEQMERLGWVRKH